MRKTILLTALSMLSISTFAAQQINIMSFNIRTATPKDSMNAWEYRREACIHMLDSIQPDVFGMQEVLPEQEAYVTDHLPLYQHVAQGRRPGLKGNESCPIYWRQDKFNLIQTRTFWLSPTPDVMSIGWDAKYQRVATYVILQDKATARQFIVFNTHLDHIGSESRVKSAEMIMEFIRTRKELQGIPVVLTGDMNDWQGSETYQTFTSSLTDAAVATAEQPDSYSTGTFHAFDPGVGYNPYLDYVFYSEGLEATVFRTVTKSIDGCLASDHFPIYADLKPAS